MELLDNLALGFVTATSLANLFFCLIGVLLGTLIGVLPGIGATATIAMLLPITFQLEPVSSLIMLAGIYYGAQYGGSTTAILINMPGNPPPPLPPLTATRWRARARRVPHLRLPPSARFSPARFPPFSWQSLHRL